MTQTRSILSFILISLLSRTDANHLRANMLEGNTSTDPETRIIGGVNVDDPDRYPYFTKLSGNDGLCGGALIAPDIVISAAFCRLEADKFVEVGKFLNLHSDAVIEKSFIGDESETIPIEGRFFFPAFPDPTNMYAYDVMILKLAKNSTKPFLKIRESSPVLGAKLTTIGLGVTNTGLSEFPVRLNEVELGYVQNDQCQVFHTDDVEISNDMLCTMGDKKDACIGDGGGPLFIKGSSVEDDELVGTFSVNKGCNNQFPGVYSRASFFYDWIATTVCRVSTDPPEYFDCISRTEPPTISLAPSRAPSLPPSSVPSISILPTESVSLGLVAWKPTQKLTWCQGHCDSDKQCAGDLVCFERSDGPVVPGCTGNGKNFLYTNFCVHKDATFSPTLTPTKSPAPTVSEKPSTVPSLHPSSLPTISFAPTIRAALKFVGWKPSVALTWCQGHCDKDIDCAGDLVCFQHADSQVIPGCAGNGKSFLYTNFCVHKDHTFSPTIAPTKSADPTISTVPTTTPTLYPTTVPTTSLAPTQTVSLKFVAWAPSELLGWCQGHCRRDSDCAGDMECFQRSGSRVVPGCTGNGNNFPYTNFCVLKDHTFSPTITPTISPAPTASPEPSAAPTSYPTTIESVALQFVAWKPNTPLGWCEGHCNSDIDCAGNFVCYQRGLSEVVPGCAGDAKKFLYANFCAHKDHTFSPTISPTKSAVPTVSQFPSIIPSSYPTNVPSTSTAPTDTVVLEFIAWAPSEPLGWCQGHCTSDVQCAGDLVCFQRSSTLVVPGCAGNSKNFLYTNFCVYKDHTYSPTIAPTISPAPTISRPPSLAPSPHPTSEPSVSSLPTEVAELEFVALVPWEPLGWCQGNCIWDQDCADDLVCFQRSVSSVVPGCSGDGESFQYTNFCVYAHHTIAPTIAPTTSAAPTMSKAPVTPTLASQTTNAAPIQQPPNTASSTSSAPIQSDMLEFVGWDPIEPLGHCQGDCDRDADCAGDMVCYDRPSRSSSVPGCADSSGFISSISSFCVQGSI